jgi:hypothetical protein
MRAKYVRAKITKMLQQVKNSKYPVAKHIMEKPK